MDGWDQGTGRGWFVRSSSSPSVTLSIFLRCCPCFPGGLVVAVNGPGRCVLRRQQADHGALRQAPGGPIGAQCGVACSLVRPLQLMASWSLRRACMHANTSLQGAGDAAEEDDVTLSTIRRSSCGVQETL